jgi:hypothetical protein
LEAPGAACFISAPKANFSGPQSAAHTDGDRRRYSAGVSGPNLKAATSPALQIWRVGFEDHAESAMMAF